jgi:hypothetical protein
MSNTKARSDALQRAHEKLQGAVAEIVTGEDWQKMLKTAAKFHRYSFSNVLLIQLQKPDATLVAGFRRWKELGSSVRKGERGIGIMAPCRYRTKVERSGRKRCSTLSLRRRWGLRW